MSVDADKNLTGAEGVEWNLTHLYDGPEDPKLMEDMDSAIEEAKAFHDAFSGKVAELEADRLKSAVEQMEAVEEKVAKAAVFAYLHFVTDTSDPARGKLLQTVQEKATAVGASLLFFMLEWARLEDNDAKKRLDDDRLTSWRRFLESARRYKPYLLTEPEEKILTEKAVTGVSAWSRFFEETLNEIPFEMDGERVTEEFVLSRMYDPDRTVRLKAADALTEGLKGASRTLTFVFNMVAADKATDDRLRSYPHWLAERNLDNHISDEMVGALIDAVISRYDLVRRYYRLKRKILGVETLYDYDRYAPITADSRSIPWDECKEIVLGAFGDFSPKMADIAGRFFDERWIHAFVKKGKRSGAFSHPAAPSVHPYVMVNYTARTRDVMTVAHELGHGVHQVLSSSQGYLKSHTPLTTAETASVFGEMLAFERLMAGLDEKGAKLALLCSKIEDVIATVFRQVSMNRFEAAFHTARRLQGELSTDEISGIWFDSQKAVFEDSVTLRDEYALWWSYIPHFIGTPGYVYAYAFGELLVFALYDRYREVGSDFIEGYLGMLSAGGSESPENVVAKAGLDLNDPELWSRGLDILGGMIAQAEEWFE